MTKILRREALQRLAAVPIAAGVAWTPEEVRTARLRTDRLGQSFIESSSSYAPIFFTDQEYATVVLLAEMILPSDQRSGGAGDARVPEFIDFMMVDQPDRQEFMRQGLALMDEECRARFDAVFVDCDESNRVTLLDAIAWPNRVPSDYGSRARARSVDPVQTLKTADLDKGVNFFSMFRDLTATGFWTSKIGIEDLQYLGNQYVVDWQGCPSEALEKLGVRYSD
jgi:gluconate 2-dehydrogenase gamma chain